LDDEKFERLLAGRTRCGVGAEASNPHEFVTIHWWGLREVHLSPPDLHISHQSITSKDLDLVITTGVGQSDDEAPGGLKFLGQPEKFQTYRLLPLITEYASDHVVYNEHYNETGGDTHGKNEENPDEKFNRIHLNSLALRCPPP